MIQVERSEELFRRSRVPLAKVRDMDEHPVMCGVLPKREAGEGWLFTTLAVNSRLPTRCSDHREIRFNLDWAETPELSLVLMPDFRRANYEGLRKHLKEVNWKALRLNGSHNSRLKSDLQEKQEKITYNNFVRIRVE